MKSSFNLWLMILGIYWLSFQNKFWIIKTSYLRRSCVYIFHRFNILFSHSILLYLYSVSINVLFNNSLWRIWTFWIPTQKNKCIRWFKLSFFFSVWKDTIMTFILYASFYKKSDYHRIKCALKKGGNIITFICFIFIFEIVQNTTTLISSGW